MVANGLDAGGNTLKGRAYHSISNTLLYFVKNKKAAAGTFRGRIRM
jgi:hypothetical protein